MDLYLELSSLQLIQAANDRRSVSKLNIKRGDALPLTVRFIQDGLPVRLDATTTISFAIKEKGKYDQDPLVLDQAFTASAVDSPDDDPHYTAEVDTNTTELNALFLLNGDPADDPATIELMGELTWIAMGDTGPTSSKTVAVFCENDVYRGDEGTPTAQPTPTAWLDTQLSSRNIQPSRQETTSLYPASLSVDGTIYDDFGDPNPTLDLLFISLDSEGYPTYSRALADAGVLTLEQLSGDWILKYSGPSTALDLTWDVPVTDSYPAGISVSSNQNGQDDLSIIDPAGTSNPKLGDIGLTTSDNKFYIWNNFWKYLYTDPASFFTTSAANPTTSDLETSGDFGIHKNTSSGSVFLAFNDSGVIKKVELT